MVSAFSTSACSESIPGDFPFFSLHFSPRGRVGVNVEAFRRFWVRSLIRLRPVRHFFEMLDPSCSLFLFSCYITFPSSFLTGLMWVLVCPLSCSVILYIVLRSPLAAAFFASSASSSTKALLPLRALFFDVLL